MTIKNIIILCHKNILKNALLQSKTKTLLDIQKEETQFRLDKIKLKIYASYLRSSQKKSIKPKSLKFKYQAITWFNSYISLNESNEQRQEHWNINSHIINQKRETNQKQRQKLLNRFIRSRLDGETKIKNRKLIQAAKIKTKNIAIAEAAEFHYNKADTELYDQNGNTPLYYSAKYGDEQMTKFLLKIGADIKKYVQTETPLFIWLFYQEINQQQQNLLIEIVILIFQTIIILLHQDSVFRKNCNLQIYLIMLQQLNKQKNKKIDNQYQIHKKIKSETYELNNELILDIKKRI
ncbi:unnamed protein product [Paramecium sonneborni]|uniref:Ankyrin repeat protein n=1 Tax=Paramecium sonneborni TaxID=65129 RepID=A0A8S1QHD2_9CILI|nr:unnamed protein product [Paramecium sonneborni]